MSEPICFVAGSYGITTRFTLPLGFSEVSIEDVSGGEPKTVPLNSIRNRTKIEISEDGGLLSVSLIGAENIEEAIEWMIRECDLDDFKVYVVEDKDSPGFNKNGSSPARSSSVVNLSAMSVLFVFRNHDDAVNFKLIYGEALNTGTYEFSDFCDQQAFD